MCRLYLANFVDIYVGFNRPTEIEFENNFSSISQHLRSTEYSTFLITKKLRIKPTEIECGSDFNKFVFNSYIPFKMLRIRPLRLNLRTISAVYPSIIIY